MKAVGLNDFTDQVIESDVPVLVDFWAAYCGPCRALKPLLQEVANEGVKVVTVDVTQEAELAQQYNVTAIPTLIVFKGGNAVQQIVGLRNKKEILDLVNV